MNKKILWLFCMACCLTLHAQEEVSYKAKQSYKSWVRLAPKLSDAFCATAEAVRIADNVLLYQQDSGGWPKNIYMPAELSPAELEDVLQAKHDVNESTIDNGATTTEIRYLSRVYQATSQERFAQGALEGIRYLLKAQYPHGGWPQFWPRNYGYYTHITYNDGAMINTMKLLREVYEHKAPYTFVPDSIRQAARIAFDKGIGCILKTQVRQGDQLTVWCAQHDEQTLAPAKARAYELPSLSGAESDDIILLLMSLPKPSEAVKASIEGAVVWLKAHRITGLYRQEYIDEQGRKDYRMAPCPEDDFPCPVLWARFYTLEDNRPFFCDRDGIPRYDLSEIGYERRNGYSWYNTDGEKVLKAYRQWKKKHE